MDSKLYLLVYLIVYVVTAQMNCVDDECAEDPIKSSLSEWYDQWVKGHQVDYITTNELRDSYDFIVIGAGIGGSIVAHRLAMDSSYPNILLLEAGGKHNTSGLSTQMVPVMAAENQLTDFDWQYLSEPSDGYCCEWNIDGRHRMPRGKITGGSAVLHTMMWVRGHKDDWDSLWNIDGWKWNDVLPYFKKTESLRTSYQHANKDRGYDGPTIINSERDLREQDAIFHESVVKAFVDSKSFEFLANGQNSDTGSNNGVGYIEYNIDDNGQRNNAFIAYNKYLRAVYKQQYDDGLINLDILPNAHVTKIVFGENDKDNKLRATGVDFADLTDNKKIYSIQLTDNGKSEIIVSGGTINSPQLLMLSGLGPKDELTKHNIKVLRDIPGIGNNLQDHTMSFMRYHWKPEYHSTEVLTLDKIANELTNFTLFKQYLFKGKGILSSAAPNVNAFIRSNTMNAKYGTKDKYPDLQFYIIAGWHDLGIIWNNKVNVTIDYECGNAEYYSDKANMMNIMTVVGLQHPESRGWIKLNSSDPFDYPLIQPNYLKEQFDVDALIEGHKILNNVMLQPSMKRLWDQKMECKKYGDLVNNDKNLEKYIRDSINNIYHQIGTCKMGDIKDDNMAVVDHHLLVRDTSNLRVVDASVFPYQTSGNIQAPVHMVAEKASDIILNNWNDKY